MPANHNQIEVRSDRNDCSTTFSFESHGVSDGIDLIHRTYYRLVDTGVTSFEPSAPFFDRLEEAFRFAYLSIATDERIPTHVEAAIDDARVMTEQEFGHVTDVDLRTTVLPRFYQHVAGFHCQYR